MFYDAGMTSNQQTGTSLHLPPIRVPAEGDESMARAKFIYSRDNGYREPSGHMDLVTNYQQQYTRKVVTPVRPFRSDRPKEDPTTRFDGTTTNASDYRVWRYDNREKPLRHPNGIVPSNGKLAGPSHYVSEYGPPGGGLSSPVAPRRPAADGSPHFSRQIPYSQQQTSPDHGLVCSSDRHQQTSADVTSVYQQTYGAAINLRNSFPPASNTRSSEGYNMTMGGGVTKTRRNGGDMESNYNRDFTRKSIMKQAAYKPRGQSILAPTNDHPFEDTTTHCEAFQRWKSERLQQASTTPAAGTSTGGGTGRQPPSQLTLSWTPTADTNSGGGLPGRYGFAGRKMGAVDRINPTTGAGLPTPGLDRTSKDFTGRRNNFTNGKTVENVETSNFRKDYADSAATAATTQRNAVSEGIATIPGEDGLPIDLSCDLQTVYRRLSRHQPEDPVILSSATNNNSVRRDHPEVVELASSGSQNNIEVKITEPVNGAFSNFVPTAEEAVAGSKPEVETVTATTEKDVHMTGGTLSTSVPEVKPFDDRRVSIIDQSESQAGQPRDQTK